MRPKSLALLVIALGCGLIASVGIMQMMGKRAAEAVPDAVPVFVAVRDLPLNEVITAESVRAEEWPKDRVPPGVATKLDEIQGHRSRTRLFAGEPIFKNRLFGMGKDEAGVSAQIPKGMRVVSVRVDAVSGNAHLIRPGDRVDVLVHLTQNLAAGIEDFGTRTILQHVKVFAVDDIVSQENMDGETKSIPAKTITLLVTPEQAQKVTLASEMGSVRLDLRHPEDDNQVVVATTSSRGLFGEAVAEGSKKKTAEELPKPSPSDEGDFRAYLKKVMTAKTSETNAVPAADATYVMRILNGPRLTEVTLQSEAQTPADDAHPKFWKTTTTTTTTSGPDPGAAAPATAPATPTERTKPTPQPTGRGQARA